MNTSASTTLATPDTWGIPGPTFAVLYLLLGIAAVMIAVIRRAAVSKSNGQPVDTESAPAEIGLLISEDNALVAAITELRVAGLIDSTGQHTRELTALDRTSHSAFVRSVFDRMPPTSSGNPADIAVPLHQLRSDLVRRGLMHSRPRRYGLPIILPVIALGVIRILAGSANRKPVGYLIAMVVVLALIALVCAARPRRLTARGTATVEQARTTYALLDPQWGPALTSFGVHRAAMAAALFGISALILIDSRLAQCRESFPRLTLQPPRPTPPRTNPGPRTTHTRRRSAGGASGVFFGSSCSSGGFSCGGGSSCGGGGSSSGSSCGGGGGCGG